ncbi:MAG: class I SAM-dependent methyltransferase [Chlamydiota bacterium]|nr:class I SAM-dependent methyltransferase [Chlamydiota bacterium]
MNQENNLAFLEILDGEDKSSPLKNKIRKNYKHIKKWAKRTRTNAFRVYDRDIKEYPIAIDYYDGRFCVHYFTKLRGSDEAPCELENLTNQALSSLFGVNDCDIFWRSRIKRKRTEQYEKVGESKEYFEIFEYGVKFWINLTDYLDTGLFLDHKETRQMVAKLAKEKRLLNLFAYTSSFSVHAATMGAKFTKSVDMSNTYTQWSRDNFQLNGLSKINNEIVRADCMKFLFDEVESGNKYDVIVIDPPTISRSKKMDEMFDIQEDYQFLIKKALMLLNDGGTIFFSTNSRKFHFDETLFKGRQIKEITHKTIPLDFHNKKIHRCWTVE